MNLFLFEPPVENLADSTIKDVSVPLQERLHDSNKGNGFADDAIRPKARPLMYTEECIAAGCREDLW